MAGADAGKAQDLPRLRLTQLKLFHFRNWGVHALKLDGRHVVLTGENGAGKTNLMEAVSLLSPGRGLRRASYGDMLQASTANGFAIHADLETPNGPFEIGTAVAAPNSEETGAQRRISINGAPAKTADALLEVLRVVWLTPAMDGLFTGTAGDRRRFLDRMVLAIDPAHGRRAADYEKALRGRNRLLAEDRPDPRWLDAVEAQIAELGIAIAAARDEVVQLLAAMIGRAGDTGPFPAADIAILRPAEEADPDGAAVEREERLRHALREGRTRDRMAGRTLCGPHRHDLSIRHRQKAMDAAMCSTGEQKALLIGLVLAHARLTGELSGLPPLLLLDEIAAHLDAGRRAALFDLVCSLGGQCFMTGTDRDLFAALGGRAQYFTVSAGTATETM